MRLRFSLGVFALAVGACSSIASGPVSSTPTPGLDFAQTHCSSCHAVVPLSMSPNPEAPTFDSIVNVRGLTLETLKTFLRDSHNFPEVMEFDVDPGQIEALAAYMLTLQETDNRPR